jgi:hypothetical protein
MPQLGKFNIEAKSEGRNLYCWKFQNCIQIEMKSYINSK